MAAFMNPERSARSGGPGLSHWLSSKLIGAPLAMQVSAAQQLKAALDARQFDSDLSVSFGPAASKFIGTKDIASRYRVTDDGFAVVPIQGTLIDRGEFLGDLGGYMTSYEGLAEQFRRIAKDESIKGVILDIDSPGGMVAGLFDVIAELTKLTAKKKVSAIAANMAASAAYAIGCAANELFVTRSGLVGSIGVIALHQSYARALDERGIDTTIVYAGDHKADGNPFQQLSHGARAEMSSSIDQSYHQFVCHVAACRGIDEPAVRATQARMYSGDSAVNSDLADGVKSFEELLDHLRVPRTARTTKASTARSSQLPKAQLDRANPGERPMSRAQGQGDAATDLQAEITNQLATLFGSAQAAAAARAPSGSPSSSRPEGTVEPVTITKAEADRLAVEAATAAVIADRERAMAILSCPEAKGREALAIRLAFKSAMSLDDAKETLGAAGTPGAGAQGQSGFALLTAAMAKPGSSAGVKPDASGTAEGSSSALSGMASLADKAKAKFTPPARNRR